MESSSVNFVHILHPFYSQWAGRRHANTRVRLLCIAKGRCCGGHWGRRYHNAVPSFAACRASVSRDIHSRLVILTINRDQEHVVVVHTVIFLLVLKAMQAGYHPMDACQAAVDLVVQYYPNAFIALVCADVQVGMMMLSTRNARIAISNEALPPGSLVYSSVSGFFAPLFIYRCATPHRTRVF